MNLLYVLQLYFKTNKLRGAQFKAEKKYTKIYIKILLLT